MALCCRRAEKKDIPALALAEKACFPQDFWSENALLSHFESAAGGAFVIEKDGALCAYLLVSVSPPEGEVLRIAALPPFRRQGYAKRLLAFFLDTVSLCFLEVRESNTPARRLYEALGFTLSGHRPHYYQNPTEDACLYKKIL